jgi:hypothetical protein
MTHLVLAAGALAKVFALHSALVPQLGVGRDDGDEVGKGVETGAAVHAHAHTLAGEGKGGDNDPGGAGSRAERERIAVGGETVDDDLDLLPEVERRLPVGRVLLCAVHGLRAEECADIVPENIVVRVRLDRPPPRNSGSLLLSDVVLGGGPRSRHGHRTSESAEQGQHHDAHVLAVQIRYMSSERNPDSHLCQSPSHGLPPHACPYPWLIQNNKRTSRVSRIYGEDRHQCCSRPRRRRLCWVPPPLYRGRGLTSYQPYPRPHGSR